MLHSHDCHHANDAWEVFKPLLVVFVLGVLMCLDMWRRERKRQGCGPERLEEGAGTSNGHAHSG